LHECHQYLEANEGAAGQSSPPNTESSIISWCQALSTIRAVAREIN